MPGEACDGMDVLAVRECVGRAVARARESKTPTLVEARTYRFRGHSMRDPAAAVYRTKDEVEEEKRRDPDRRLFRERLREAGALDEADLAGPGRAGGGAGQRRGGVRRGLAGAAGGVADRGRLRVRAGGARGARRGRQAWR